MPQDDEGNLKQFQNIELGRINKQWNGIFLKDKIRNICKKNHKLSDKS